MILCMDRVHSLWLITVLSLFHSSTACPKSCVCLGNAVSCENQDFRSIPWNTFPKWTESLSLRQIHGFQHLSTSVMESLTRLDGLKHLNITCHEKLDLDARWLQHLPSLEVLKISHCQLEKVPVFHPPHRNLKSLILNRNYITKLRVESFDSLPNLIRLEVNFNRLEELSRDWFRKGHPLQILSANGNHISRLDPLLNLTLTGLRELRLNRNRLCRLSSRFFTKSKNLGVGSKLSSITIKSGSNLPLPERSSTDAGESLPLNSEQRRIRKRQTGSNACNGINNELPSMPLVHTLELSRNKISSISTLTFQYWKSLKVLRLKRNLLTKGSLKPGAFFIDKAGLTTLDLTANKRLNQIDPGWLFAYRGVSLRELIVAKCGLRSSVGVKLFRFHKKLVRLDFSGNKLDHLAVGQFSELSNLEELNLSGNRLKGLPAGVFKGLGSLRKMSLADNIITSLTPEEPFNPRPIPASSKLNSLFQPLSALVELDVAHNRLTRIDRNDLAGLSSLRSLDLRRNNITRFSPPEEHSPNLRRLMMDSSHFTCDCSAMPLFRWLRQKLPQEVASMVTANCSHPARFAGKQLMNLNMGEFSRCGPQALLEPRIVFRGNTSVWVLRNGNLTLRCEIMVAGIPVSWSNEKRMKVRPRVTWEQVDTSSSRRTLILGTSVLPTDTQFKVVDLIAVQKAGAKKTSARWLSLLRIKPGSYMENLGAFQCKAENSYGHDSSPLVQVAVYQLPRFTDHPPRLISSLAGNVVTIPCSAVGTPPPVPVLHKFGVTDFPAARDRRLSIYNGDTCFTIANVQRKDAGNYVCESENEAGKVSFHFKLVVNEIPNFKKWPRPKSVFTVGQSAVLSCMATGWPFPSITWTKNGQPLNLNSAPISSPLLNNSIEATTLSPRSTLSTAPSLASRQSEELQLAERGQLLLFLNVAPHHAAEYECTLLNVVGRKRTKIVVDVRTADGLVYSGSQRREEESGGRRRGSRLSRHMTGIIVIAVVVCVVATSLAWVAALYCFRWRKRAAAAAAASSAASGCPQTSSIIHPGRRPLLGRSVSSNSEIFMTSRAGLGSYSILHGLGLSQNYHLGVDEEDFVDNANTARYLLEEHRMLRRDATRAYDVATSEPCGVEEQREEGEAVDEESTEENRRPEGAPTSDYNTGTSSECSAHSLCVSGAANGSMTTTKASGPCSRCEHLPVSASSPLLHHHPPCQTEACNSAMFAYLTIPPQPDVPPGIPEVTSFGVVLHETDEYV